MLHFCLPLPIRLPGWSSLLLPHHRIEPDWVILLLNASVFHQGSHKARSNQPTERFTEKNAIKSRDLTHSGLDYQSINIPKVKWGKGYTLLKTQAVRMHKLKQSHCSVGPLMPTQPTFPHVKNQAVLSAIQRIKRKEVLFSFHTCIFLSLAPNEIEVDAVINASCSLWVVSTYLTSSNDTRSWPQSLCCFLSKKQETACCHQLPLKHFTKTCKTCKASPIMHSNSVQQLQY